MAVLRVENYDGSGITVANMLDDINSYVIRTTYFPVEFIDCNYNDFTFELFAKRSYLAGDSNYFSIPIVNSDTMSINGKNYLIIQFSTTDLPTGLPSGVIYNHDIKLSISGSTNIVDINNNNIGTSVDLTSKSIFCNVDRSLFGNIDIESCLLLDEGLNQLNVNNGGVPYAFFQAIYYPIFNDNLDNKFNSYQVVSNRNMPPMSVKVLFKSEKEENFDKAVNYIKLKWNGNYFEGNSRDSIHNFLPDTKYTFDFLINKNYLKTYMIGTPGLINLTIEHFTKIKELCFYDIFNGLSVGMNKVNNDGAQADIDNERDNLASLLSDRQSLWELTTTNVVFSDTIIVDSLEDTYIDKTNPNTNYYNEPLFINANNINDLSKTNIIRFDWDSLIQEIIDNKLTRQDFNSFGLRVKLDNPSGGQSGYMRVSRFGNPDEFDTDVSLDTITYSLAEINDLLIYNGFAIADRIVSLGDNMYDIYFTNAYNDYPNIINDIFEYVDYLQSTSALKNVEVPSKSLFGNIDDTNNKYFSFHENRPTLLYDNDDIGNKWTNGYSWGLTKYEDTTWNGLYYDRSMPENGAVSYIAIELTTWASTKIANVFGVNKVDGSTVGAKSISFYNRSYKQIPPTPGAAPEYAVFPVYKFSVITKNGDLTSVIDDYTTVHPLSVRIDTIGGYRLWGSIDDEGWITLPTDKNGNVYAGKITISFSEEVNGSTFAIRTFYNAPLTGSNSISPMYKSNGGGIDDTQNPNTNQFAIMPRGFGVYGDVNKTYPSSFKYDLALQKPGTRIVQGDGVYKPQLLMFVNSKINNADGPTNSGNIITNPDTGDKFAESKNPRFDVMPEVSTLYSELNGVTIVWNCNIPGVTGLNGEYLVGTDLPTMTITAKKIDIETGQILIDNVDLSNAISGSGFKWQSSVGSKNKEVNRKVDEQTFPHVFVASINLRNIVQELPDVTLDSLTSMYVFNINIETVNGLQYYNYNNWINEEFNDKIRMITVDGVANYSDTISIVGDRMMYFDNPSTIRSKGNGPLGYRVHTPGVLDITPFVGSYNPDYNKDIPTNGFAIKKFSDNLIADYSVDENVVGKIGYWFFNSNGIFCGFKRHDIETSSTEKTDSLDGISGLEDGGDNGPTGRVITPEMVVINNANVYKIENSSDVRLVVDKSQDTNNNAKLYYRFYAIPGQDPGDSAYVGPISPNNKGWDILNTLTKNTEYRCVYKIVDNDGVVEGPLLSGGNLSDDYKTLLFSDTVTTDSYGGNCEIDTSPTEDISPTKTSVYINVSPINCTIDSLMGAITGKIKFRKKLTGTYGPEYNMKMVKNGEKAYLYCVLGDIDSSGVGTGKNTALDPETDYYYIITLNNNTNKPFTNDNLFTFSIDEQKFTTSAIDEGESVVVPDGVSSFIVIPNVSDSASGTSFDTTFDIYFRKAYNKDNSQTGIKYSLYYCYQEGFGNWTGDLRNVIGKESSVIDDNIGYNSINKWQIIPECSGKLYSQLTSVDNITHNGINYVDLYKVSVGSLKGFPNNFKKGQFILKLVVDNTKTPMYSYGNSIFRTNWSKPPVKPFNLKVNGSLITGINTVIDSGKWNQFTFNVNNSVNLGKFGIRFKTSDDIWGEKQYKIITANANDSIDKEGSFTVWSDEDYPLNELYAYFEAGKTYDGQIIIYDTADINIPSEPLDFRFRTEDITNLPVINEFVNDTCDTENPTFTWNPNCVEGSIQNNYKFRIITNNTVVYNYNMSGTLPSNKNEFHTLTGFDLNDATVYTIELAIQTFDEETSTYAWTGFKSYQFTTALYPPQAATLELLYKDDINGANHFIINEPEVKENITQYNVWRIGPEDNYSLSYKLIDDTELTFSDFSPAYNKPYYYYIEAVAINGAKSYSNVITVQTKLLGANIVDVPNYKYFVSLISEPNRSESIDNLKTYVYTSGEELPISVSSDNQSIKINHTYKFTKEDNLNTLRQLNSYTKKGGTPCLYRDDSGRKYFVDIERLNIDDLVWDGNKRWYDIQIPLTVVRFEEALDKKSIYDVNIPNLINIIIEYNG